MGVDLAVGVDLGVGVDLAVGVDVDLLSAPKSNTGARQVSEPC